MRGPGNGRKRRTRRVLGAVGYGKGLALVQVCSLSSADAGHRRGRLPTLCLLARRKRGALTPPTRTPTPPRVAACPTDVQGIKMSIYLSPFRRQILIAMRSAIRNVGSWARWCHVPSGTATQRPQRSRHRLSTPLGEDVSFGAGVSRGVSVGESALLATCRAYDVACGW